MTIEIAIAHASWRPERRTVLRRLVEALEPPAPMVFGSTEPEHSSVWALRMWRWAQHQRCSHVVFLNDDVQPCPEFILACGAIARAVPEAVVALHTTIRQATPQDRWLWSYWLSGPAYMVPRPLVRDMVAFCERWPDLFQRVNEDVMLMHWAWGRRRPIWHAVPALVQHDVSVPSTLGYDMHPGRQTHVPWSVLPDARLTDEDFWRPRGSPQLVECHWMTTATLEAMRLERERASA